MASEFVRFNDISKNFEVADEAVKLLRALTGPICLVAVCGRARQGKSFLLNQLLAKLQGPAPSPPPAASARFAVGSTVKPCTKGLWLWSRPIARTLPNGQNYHLVLVDAEGIDSYDQTADYSNHIFSLALLLSSLLVYNQMGSIDESSVDKLASVCEFARLIRGKADSSASAHHVGSGGDLLRDLAPSFVWLLRDFQFQLTEDGRQLTVRDYMEEVLRELPGSSDGIRAKNQLRASIKSIFHDRDCHALVRPMLDEAQLARMDSLPLSHLRPEFKKGLDSLAELLLARCRPKSLRGSPLTGPALAGLAEAYCRVINEGGVPAIASTWQSVVQSECRRALDLAIDLYRSRLEAARGSEVGLDGLEAAHTTALEAAVEAFNKQAVGEPGEREGFLRRLREAAVAAVGPLRQIKRAEAEARTSDMLAAGAKRFLQSVRDDDSDLAAAESQLHTFLRQYAAEGGLGPDKYIKAAEFLAGTVVPELRRLAQMWRTKAAAAERRVAELEAKAAELASRSDSTRASLDSATLAEAQLRRELSAARGEAAAAGARLTAAQAAAAGSAGEVAALREQLAAARVETAGRVEAAAADVNRLRSELAAAHSQRAAADSAAQQAAAARTAAAQQLAAREAALAARTAESEAARRAAEATRATEVQLRQQAETLSAQLFSREATLANLQRERYFMQAQLDEQKRTMDEQDHRLSTAADATAAAAVATAAAVAATAPRRSPPPADAWGGGPGAGAGAAAPGPSTGAGGGGAMAAAANTGRKRGRGAAGLDADVGRHDVDMVDAGPGGGGEDFELVEVVEAMAGRNDGSAAAEPPRPATRRQRTPAVSDRRRTCVAVATPVATAVAAAPLPAPTDGAAAGNPGTPAAATDGSPGGGGVQQRTPFSSEREVVLRTTPGGSATRAARSHGVAGATAASSRPPLPANVEAMKVNELKDWLTSHGLEAEVFELNWARPPPSKKDWLALVRAQCAPGPECV